MKYEILFKKIIKQKHGMDINFEKIEEALQHLREGDALAYDDLLTIADDSCWPFSKYWMWPSKEQIEEKLTKTKGWFKNLNDHPEIEAEVINDLCEIFRNIALVSIILRFVFPKHYAIYSRPPLKILRVERGSNDVEEYLNYLEVLRLLKRSFGVSKTADLDIIVWTIAQEKGEYARQLKKLLAKQLPENLKPGELINQLSSNPLKIAECYLKQGDWKAAGFYAACFYERIKDQYWIDRDTFKKIRHLRTKVIHESERFSKTDARDFIESLKNIVPADI